MPYGSLILRYWREALFSAVVIPLAFGFWLRGERLDAEKAAHKLTKAAFEQQVSDYRTAYQTAVAEAQAAARKVEADQERITHEVSADYQSRLADVRARYQRLLAKTEADSGRAGAPDLPGVSASAGGPDAAAACAGLPLAARLVATEQAIQLDALQDWIRRQAGVER